MDDRTAIQNRCIEYLASGMKIAETARTIRVNRKTIHEWLNLPGFKKEIRTRTSDNLLDLSKKVIHVLNKNLIRIEKVFDDKRSSTSEIIRAYGLLLRNIRVLIELGDLGERVSALEEQVNG